MNFDKIMKKQKRCPRLGMNEKTPHW